jgi:hypothetical protein
MTTWLGAAAILVSVHTEPPQLIELVIFGEIVRGELEVVTLLVMA